MRDDNPKLLERMQHFKAVIRPGPATLGGEMVAFFKRTVGQRHTQLSKIAERWVELIPQTLNDHCALHSLSRGTLTVRVDSSVHLYELKQVLLAGLQDQLLLACRSAGLRKIALKPGRPDSGDETEQRS